jgi:UDP-N-acetylmuramoyl-tripeptide--D-alanyl-D-alanine ligase
MQLYIEDILKATGGSLVKGDKRAIIKGVSIDTRAINAGEIFFALVGKRFDGHDFIPNLEENGATGTVVNGDWEGLSALEKPPSGLCVISVNDTLSALGDTARFWRDKYPVPLAAVGGSCGKTTTKEMIAAILGVNMTVHKTEGNKNNLIGLPLTILGLEDSHQIAVVELGISEREEMTRLAEISKPDVALLTNIGVAHISTLGGIEEVARAKGELFTMLKPDGIEVINLDDPWIVRMVDKSHRRRVTYSLNGKGDIQLKSCEVDGLSPDKFIARFSVYDNDIVVKINSIGKHNLYNAAAAIATTFALGAGCEDIVEGLSRFIPMKGRMELLKLDNITILDDTYNASPESVEVALKTLSTFSGRKIAVLGDMYELGDFAKNLHKSIGATVYRLGIDLLIVYGEFKEEVCDGAVSEGMASGCVHRVATKDDIVNMLKDSMRDGDVILVKGSRAAGMEDVVEKLRIKTKNTTNRFYDKDLNKPQIKNQNADKRIKI